MQQFNKISTYSNVIKNLLAMTYLPLIRSVREGDYICMDRLYIFRCDIIKCTSSGYIGKELYLANSPIAKWERIGEFHFGDKDGKLSTNYVSNVEGYDYKTHERLGQYLRNLRDMYGLNLMPLYNCFSNQPFENHIIKNNRIIKTSEDNNTKIYKIPIRFNQDYTVCIENLGITTFAPAFIRYNSLLKQNNTQYGNGVDVTNQYINLHCADNIHSIANLSFGRPYKVRFNNKPEHKELTTYNSFDKIFNENINIPESSLVNFEVPYIAINAEATSLVLNMEATQDLHGYSKPWPGGGNYNQWDEEWEAGSINIANGQNMVSPNPTSIRSKNYIKVTPGEEYTFYLDPRLVSTQPAVTIYYYNDDEYKTYRSYYLGPNTHTFTFTVPAPYSPNYMRFSISPLPSNYNGGGIAVNYPSSITTYTPYANICSINAWEDVDVVVSPTTNAEDGTTYTSHVADGDGVLLGKGTLNLITGKLIRTHAVEIFTGSEEYESDWERITIGPNNLPYFRYPLSYVSELNDSFCSTFPFEDSSIIQTATNLDNFYTIDTIYDTPFLFIRYDSIDNLEDFRVWLSNNNIQLYYKESTPWEYDLTPQEIELLMGQNNIWSDAGNVSIDCSIDVKKEAFFSTNILYDISNEVCSQFDEVEDHLYLLIQVPKVFNQNIVVLEGDYTELESQKIVDSLFRDKLPDFLYDAFYTHDLNLMTHTSTEPRPFSPALVEFLLWNAICNLDTINNDMDRLSALMQDKYIPYTEDIFSLYPNFWVKRYRQIISDYVNYNSTNVIQDNLGYVTRNIEEKLYKDPSNTPIIIGG